MGEVPLYRERELCYFQLQGERRSFQGFLEIKNTHRP